MKKSNIYHILILVLIFVSCKNEDKQIIDEYINSEGQNVIEYKLNDSIIERVMKKNDKLEARELENILSDSIEIFYYDEFDKLYQSLKFNTKNPKGLLYNYVYYTDGGISEKHIKSQDGEELAMFKYSFFDKLEKECYFREGQLNINSFVSYNSYGKIDLRKRKTQFIKLTERNDSILINLIGNEKNHYRFIRFLVFDKYPENSDDVVEILMEKEVENANQISIAKSDLSKFKNKIMCSVEFINTESDGIMNKIKQELFIESLNNIPTNNLFYIRRY